MPSIAQTVLIHAPLAVVFAYHSDPTTAVEWSPNVTAIRHLTGDPHVADTRWTVVGRIPPLPLPIEAHFRVVECTPPHLQRLTMEGLATATITTRYEAVGATTTRLDTTSEYRPPATFFTRVVDENLVQRVLAADVRRNLANLKRILEAREHRV